MTSKVFLFDRYNYIYCSDVKFVDNKYTGWVENGAWHLTYDTSTSLLKSYIHQKDKVPVLSHTTKLKWMCDPIKGDYNTVIENAKERFENGEVSNTILIEQNDELEDEIPF